MNRKFYYSKGSTVGNNFVTTLVEITVVTFLLASSVHELEPAKSWRSGLRRSLLEFR